MLVWLFDSSSKLDQNDIEITDFLKKLILDIPVIGVLNKSDLPSELSSADLHRLRFPFSAVLHVSAKTGAGVAGLLNEIAKTAGISDKNDYLMINSRHFVLLQNALESLIKTKQALATKDADEIACFEAVQAQTALNEILGINVNQDILDEIFSTFCIGK